MRPFLLLAAVVVLLALASRPARADGPAPLEMRPPGEWSTFTPLHIPKPPGLDEAGTPPVPPPAPDLKAFAGKPITRIIAVPDGGDWGGIAPPTFTSLHGGELLDGASARSALEEALGTGRFASGRVEVQADGVGVALVVRLVPRKLIDGLEVDLHGAQVARDEVLRQANLTAGGEFIATGLDDAKRAIKDVFLRHGYPSATVTLLARPTDDPTRVALLLDVLPGHKRLVEKRWFYLYGAAPEDVRSIVQGYAVSVGDRADEDALSAADDALANALRAAGWYKANVFHDLVLAPLPKGVVLRDEPNKKTVTTLRVRVETGAKTILRFDGSDSYDDDTLVATIGADAESDRTIGHFGDKLHDFYVKRGFLDVEVTPETRGTDTDRTIAFVFHVIEHRRVFVRSRTYPCLDPREIGRLNGTGPRSTAAIGSEIDSFLEEELPGGDFLRNPDSHGLDTILGPATGVIATGTRPVPIDLDPDHVFVQDTYDRAATHVQELYRNEGYLHALVGPVSVVRAQCRPGTQPNVCIPLPLPPIPTNQCTFDTANLPAPTDALPDKYTCRPNPAAGISCAPEVDLLITVKLGPRTRFYDLTFEGASSITEQELARVAALDLGEPVNTQRIEDARKRLIDLYKDRGFFWVSITYSLDYSLDNTNARVSFQIAEGELVTVKEIVLRGNDDTSDSVIRKRIALEVGKPYSSSKVRLTQQFLGTLGVFSSIDIQLEDQYVPASSKRVIVTLVEKLPQHIQPSIGFSTGEGFRGSIEYGDLNVAGDAISFTGRIQASYLPDALFFDQSVLQEIKNANLTTFERIARRITLSLGFPEIGLGPRARTTLDLSDIQYLERDFALTKNSVYATIVYNLAPQMQVSASQSVEQSNVKLYEEGSIQQYLQANQDNPDLGRLLRVPNGDSIAVAQNLQFTWDRRDSALAAHRGTFLATGAELVNSFPLGHAPDGVQYFVGHFVRLTGKLAGYVPLSKTVTFAAELRFGQNVHLYKSPDEQTYPDRLFFLGGPDSMRGWLLDALVPQEYVNQIANYSSLPPSDPRRFTVANVPIRGGDFMINPKFEVRFPLRPPVESVLFLDMGNVWTDPSYLFCKGWAGPGKGLVSSTCGSFELRAAIGTGLRISTPVGPIVFDYGFNITRQSSYDDIGAFNFAIGLF